MTHSLIKNTRINAVMIIRQTSCPSTVSINALLTKEYFVSELKKLTSDKREGCRSDECSMVESSAGFAEIKVRLQRKKFRERGRMILTKNSPMDELERPEVGA